MKLKTLMIFILILALVCIPCLVSLAEGDSDSSPTEPASSASTEIESSSSDEPGSDSSDSEAAEPDSSEPDESDSSKPEPSSSKPESSSSGSRFTGDPVKGKTPKFADLELGDGDPDDGKDFKLEPEENGEFSEVVIRNTEAKGMKGNDNFRIEFEDCELWLPIEIPASCVEDDHINSKLVVSYGPADESILDRVSSAIKSSHILQDFTLLMTAYDMKGYPTELNSFDGRIKYIYSINAACVNRYKSDGKLALMFYNSETRTLENIDYEIDADNGKLTVYSSGSGSFFLINSNDIDVSTTIKLNSNAPFLKVVLFAGAAMSIGASVVLAALIIIKNRKGKSAKSGKHSA